MAGQISDDTSCCRSQCCGRQECLPSAYPGGGATSATCHGQPNPAAQPSSNLRLIPTPVQHLGYNLTLLHGKMMGHRGDSARKGCPAKPPIRASPRCFHLDQFSTSLRFNFDAKLQRLATARKSSTQRRARESNPQPLSGHHISSVAASHSLTLRDASHNAILRHLRLPVKRARGYWTVLTVRLC